MLEKTVKLKENLNNVILGKEEVVELVIVSILSGGHILMDDVPGVGKTTLAKALALSIDGNFNRVQFTPDLLPSDIIGNYIYNPKTGEFNLKKGVVFTNIFLADEINRASPRTQSALLESMSEFQVSIDGNLHILPKPFIVIATENPVEYRGTYPLPEAQLDRFSIEINIGYPDEATELKILYSRKTKDPLSEIKPVISCEELCVIQEKIKEIYIDKSIGLYMTKIVRATRNDIRIKLGASPRSLLALSKTSQALAYMRERDHIIPDDIKYLTESVLAHRIILDNKTKYEGITNKDVIRDIVKSIKVPV